MVATANITRALAALTGVTVAVGVGVAAAAPAGAQAAPRLHVVRTLSRAYIGPLQFAVAGKRVYVADAFASTLNRIGRSRPLASNPGEGHDLTGVAVDRASGAIAYTTSTAVGEEGVHTAAALTILRPGHRRLVVNLFKFEQRHNPDRILHYGVEGHVTSCVRKAFQGAGAPVKYTGLLDTHPYGVASLGHGSWAVADAGGNDILRVQPNGRVHTLSVLPRQPLKITAGFAKANHLAACTVGVTYAFEAVPTDVEVGPHGRLYATALPGGDGVPGSVYSLSAHHYGRAHRVATGFAGATNLAINKAGDIFVAELYSGTVAEIRPGGAPHPVLSLPGVAAVEYANGHLYASTAPAALSEGSGPPQHGSIVELGR